MSMEREAALNELIVYADGGLYLSPDGSERLVKPGRYLVTRARLGDVVYVHEGGFSTTERDGSIAFRAHILPPGFADWAYDTYLYAVDESRFMELVTEISGRWEAAQAKGSKP